MPHLIQRYQRERSKTPVPVHQGAADGEGAPQDELKKSYYGDSQESDNITNSKSSKGSKGSKECKESKNTQGDVHVEDNQDPASSLLSFAQTASAQIKADVNMNSHPHSMITTTTTSATSATVTPHHSATNKRVTASDAATATDDPADAGTGTDAKGVATAASKEKRQPKVFTFEGTYKQAAGSSSSSSSLVTPAQSQTKTKAEKIVYTSVKGTGSGTGSGTGAGTGAVVQTPMRSDGGTDWYTQQKNELYMRQQQQQFAHLPYGSTAAASTHPFMHTPATAYYPPYPSFFPNTMTASASSATTTTAAAASGMPGLPVPPGMRHPQMMSNPYYHYINPYTHHQGHIPFTPASSSSYMNARTPVAKNDTVKKELDSDLQQLSSANTSGIGNKDVRGDGDNNNDNHDAKEEEKETQEKPQQEIVVTTPPSPAAASTRKDSSQEGDDVESEVAPRNIIINNSNNYNKRSIEIKQSKNDDDEQTDTQTKRLKKTATTSTSASTENNNHTKQHNNMMMTMMMSGNTSTNTNTTLDQQQPYFSPYHLHPHHPGIMHHPSSSYPPPYLMHMYGYPQTSQMLSPTHRTYPHDMRMMSMLGGTEMHPLMNGKGEYEQSRRGMRNVDDKTNPPKGQNVQRCEKIMPPITLKVWSDDELKNTTIPDFPHLVNFPAHLHRFRSMSDGDKDTRRCVMCGESRVCSASVIQSFPRSKQTKSNHSGGGRNQSIDESSTNTNHIIPKQNKGLCTACDVAVWVIKESGIEIKWCKGCKNFRPWVAFGDKGLATKCTRCRDRQREKYAFQKEMSKKTGGCNIGSSEKLSPKKDTPHKSKVQSNNGASSFMSPANHGMSCLIEATARVSGQKPKKDGSS